MSLNAWAANSMCPQSFAWLGSDQNQQSEIDRRDATIEQLKNQVAYLDNQNLLLCQKLAERPAEFGELEVERRVRGSVIHFQEAVARLSKENRELSSSNARLMSRLCALENSNIAFRAAATRRRNKRRK